MRRELRTKAPTVSDAAGYLRSEQGFACRLVDIERGRGASSDDARRIVARRLKVGPGTFERIIRGRVKRIDAAIRDKLSALVERELRAEIARLTHELEMARQGRMGLTQEQVGEIAAHLSAARTLMNQGGKP